MLRVYLCSSNRGERLHRCRSATGRRTTIFQGLSHLSNELRTAHRANDQRYSSVPLPTDARRPLPCPLCVLQIVPLLTYLPYPEHTDGRIPLLVKAADSFIYCVSVAGTTGARKDLPEELPAFLAGIRKHTNLPLAVGFGVSANYHSLCLCILLSSRSSFLARFLQVIISSKLASWQRAWWSDQRSSTRSARQSVCNA